MSLQLDYKFKITTVLVKLRLLSLEAKKIEDVWCVFAVRKKNAHSEIDL